MGEWETRPIVAATERGGTVLLALFSTAARPGLDWESVSAAILTGNYELPVSARGGSMLPGNLNTAQSGPASGGTQQWFIKDGHI